MLLLVAWYYAFVKCMYTVKREFNTCFLTDGQSFRLVQIQSIFNQQIKYDPEMGDLFSLKNKKKKKKNIVGKGENAGYQHFLLSPQCFQKASLAGSLKVGFNGTGRDSLTEIYERVVERADQEQSVRLCQLILISTLRKMNSLIVNSRISDNSYIELDNAQTPYNVAVPASIHTV